MHKNPETILVVDDQPLNVEMLSTALSDEYTVLTATTGQEAVNVAYEQIPDLILLDIVLPDISGHDVCVTLKENAITKHIPIIFVTGKDAMEDELIGLKLGAVDYFRKPFAVPLVRARVNHQIELLRKTRMLEEMAWLDGLTGIANRRLFDKRYMQACRYAQRHGRYICLMLLDIDYFKQYNDHYGHTKGDETLKRVASVLVNNASRPFDLVARYGGEEFAVLLTDNDPKAGPLVGEKLRAAIESLGIEHAKSDINQVLSVSVGVCSALCTGQAIDQQALLKAADDCLYLAKHNGRNTIMSTIVEL